jgi:hypothetical protein
MRYKNVFSIFLTTALICTSGAVFAELGREKLKCIEKGENFSDLRTAYKHRLNVENLSELADDIGTATELVNKFGIGGRYITFRVDNATQFESGDNIGQKDVFRLQLWDGSQNVMSGNFRAHYDVPEIGGCTTIGAYLDIRDTPYGTKDCSDHDWCLLTDANRKNGFFGDTDCGNAFGDAAKDVLALAFKRIKRNKCKKEWR